MSSPLVFLTGGTGHIGFNTLILLLKAGYRVRAAVRSEAKAKKLFQNPAFKAGNFPNSQLTFVIVPDLTVPNAYDDVVSGADYIIHIASPLVTGKEMSQEEYQQYFIKPAAQGSIGILEAAAKAPTVKRVVITSSALAILPFEKVVTGSTEDVYDAEFRRPFNPGPYAAEMQAYAESKVKAFEATEQWISKNNPSFSVVNIHPTFVFGRDDLIQKAEDVFTGTNGIVMRIAKGINSPVAIAAVSVHADDVAYLHANAIKPEIPAGSYLATYNPAGSFAGSKWEEVSATVAKHFPEAVKSGVLPNNGVQAAVTNLLDASKTEKTFGIKFKNLEEQTTSVVGHYLELLAKEQ